MTLVVTHANGFLGCFTREADGTMRQRALIDTGDQPPTPEALAILGDGLDGQWGWSMQALAGAPATKGKRKALPPAPADRKTKVVDTSKRKRVKRAVKNPWGSSGHPEDPKPADRPAIVLAYLRATPYQTAAEIIAGIGLEPNHSRQSRWHHVFTHMVKARMMDRRQRVDSSGKAWEYWPL